MKVITLPLWGRVAKAAGANQLLWIGGIGIVRPTERRLARFVVAGASTAVDLSPRMK